MRSLAMTAILIAACQSPLCGQAISRSESLRVIKKMKADSQRNFYGWRSLLMYCEPPDSEAEALCDSAFTQVKYLAAISNVSVQTTRSPGEFSFSMWWRRESLPLSLLISGTKPGDSPSALNAILRATAPFSDAVEKGKNTSIARSGDLIIWERSAIGASSTNREQLFIEFSRAIESLLKQFFADYSGAQRRGLRTPKRPDRAD